MPTVSQATGNRYGPELNDFLRAKGFDLSRHAPASKVEIQRAIHSLSDPFGVSCETFETILTMEWTPTCAYLDLMLSESDIGIFPACIKIIRVYCDAEGHELLDHAYGFLCLQVMALSVRVAMLSQTNELQPLLATVPEQPVDRSISGVLHSRICHIERHAMYGSQKYSLAWLFGWYTDDKTDQLSCLPQMGGCTILDAKFLVEKLWDARAQFLRAARWAAMIFPKWSSFLHVIWHTLSENYGGTGPTFREEIQVLHQRRSWIRFVDITHRYALCSDDHEDHIVLLMLLHCPTFTNIWPNFQPRNALDTLDSNQIAEALLRKLSRQPHSFSGSHATLLTAIFGYTATNLDKCSFKDITSRIFMATFQRSWDGLSKLHELESRDYGELVYHIMNIISMFPLMLKEYQTRAVSLVKAATSEELFDILGRLVMFLTTPAGRSKIESEKDLGGKPPSRLLLQKMWALASDLANHHEIVNSEQSILLFPSWYRTLKGLDFHRLLFGDTPRSGPSGSCDIRDWEVVWLQLGGPLGLISTYLTFSYGETPQCAYPRCAAPGILLLWQCVGCHAKCYCSRRCQQADWVLSLNPHMFNCEKELLHEEEEAEELED